jgi:FlaA1/EpsC-like NDP-sugar epimerase
MELNACEAVKNNVVGTRLVAEVAARFGVERFTLISTDKAVSPTSIMGATKRCAELVVHALAGSTSMRCAVVRFGNVLGSNGSVVPRFVDQIRKGGPVTVTHPEMRRYFMLISEAVQLVLHASALDERGVVYVLEMGEQIKLLEMARHLIRLSGLVPDEDIPIQFVGLRPGEKLAERLVGDDEHATASGVQSVLRVRPLTLPAAEYLTQHIAALEHAALRNDAVMAFSEIAALVPSFEVGEVALALARLSASKSQERWTTLPEGRRTLDRRDPLCADRRRSGWAGGRRANDRVAVLVTPAPHIQEPHAV